MTNLQNKYNKLLEELKKSLEVSNTLAMPKFEKIVVNVGLGEALKNSAAIDKVIADITDITGQKPMVNKARKSISNFSLRQGDIVGVSVTLRADRMWDFLDRFMNLALPRVKDFRGVKKRSDDAGNYTFAVQDMSIFPEYDNTKLDKIRGMEVTIVIRNSDRSKSEKVLTSLGMPFEKNH